MAEIEIGHSHLFPYAVALARANRARIIYIEPRIPGIVTPDVLGIRESAHVSSWNDVKWIVTEPPKNVEKPLVIVQIETSTGGKLGSKGGDETLKRHAPAASFADFFYILDRARDKTTNRRRITNLIPGATIYSEDEVVKMFGKIHLNIERTT